MTYYTGRVVWVVNEYVGFYNLHTHKTDAFLSLGNGSIFLEEGWVAAVFATRIQLLAWLQLHHG